MGVNLLQNGGSDSAVPEIVLTGYAVRVTGQSRSGAYSMCLETRRGFAPDESQAVWPSFTVVSGTKYRIALWADGDDVDNGVSLLVRVDAGSGSYSTVKTIAEPTAGLGYVRYTAEFTATGTTARLRLESAPTAVLLAVEKWYVDDISIEEDTMAIKLAERGVAAVVTLLQDELGTELGLIDTDRADSITMAVPPAGNYYTYPREEISEGTTHIEVFEGVIDFINPYSDTDAGRAVYELPLTVRVTHLNRSGDTAAQMVQRTQRYASGVFLVFNKNPLLKSVDAAIQVGVAEQIIPSWEFDDEDSNVIVKTQTTIPITLRCEEVQ